MPAAALVSSYSLIITLGALAGALVVVLTQARAWLVTLLAFAAGVMLGAAFFHLLPEAYEGAGFWAFVLVPAGFVALLVLERYVLTHACEEPPDCPEHTHKHGLGLAAFIGLSLHTLFDGVALGSAVREGVGSMAMLAIVSHKVPASLSLASILKAEGRRAGSILGLALLYGLMVPVGAVLYFALDAVVKLEALAPRALAFSAGTFLYVAASDLLPQVRRHGQGQQGRNLVAMGVGLALMLALAQVTRHGAH